MKYVTNAISGIWNSLGCPANEGEGITLSIRESGISDNNSLIRLCGIDQSEKSIGVLSEYSEISELIVMLPMIQKVVPSITDPEIMPLEEEAAEVIDTECQDCRDLSCEETYSDYVSENLILSPSDDPKKYYKSIIEDAYLFTIKEEFINKILEVSDYKKLSIHEIKKILLEKEQTLNKENTIVNLLFCMINYYIPPHLNWLLDKSIPPIAFYCTEFKTILTKQDLSNIWQGTMPDKCIEPEEEEIEIEHFLINEEIFGGYDIKNLENVKMSIFKCKKIANSDYYSLIASKNTENKDNWYNYNWPYDNFSLIEYSRIDISEIDERSVSEEQTVGFFK